MAHVKYGVPELHRGVDSEQLERHAQVGEPLHPHEPGDPVVRLLALQIFQKRYFKSY